MSKGAVVDTGPLVAIVRDQEEAHARCVSTLKGLRSPLLTCWPVITEVAWLLRREPGAMKVIDGLVSSGAVQLVELDAQALSGPWRSWSVTQRLGPSSPMRPWCSSPSEKASRRSLPSTGEISPSTARATDGLSRLFRKRNR